MAGGPEQYNIAHGVLCRQTEETLQARGEGEGGGKKESGERRSESKSG